MLSPQPRPIGLLDTTVQLSGLATNVLLAAGALKPALDYFLMHSGSPVATVIYPKGSHHATPFVRTIKLNTPSSMPPLQPSCGLIFGMSVCFLSLVVAGSFLVRTHAGSHSPGPSSPPPLRSSQTLTHNPEQRQAQVRREAPRRSGRGLPDPIPPNNNRNTIPTEDMKHHRPYKRPPPRAGIGAPPPPPPPPPPAATAVNADKAGRKAGGNTLWRCLFGLSLMALFVKYTSTSDDRYCSHADDILIDSDDTSSMPPNSLGSMELQHSSVALRNPLGPLLTRLQVVHEAISYFIPTFFSSPCLFLRLAVDYLLCTLLCRILSTICALASGSTAIHQVEKDEIIQVESGLLNEQDIPQLPCEDIPTQVDQLEDLGNSEQVCDVPSTAEDMVVLVSNAPNPAEDMAVLVSDPPNPAEDTVVLVSNAPNPAEDMVVLAPNPADMVVLVSDPPNPAEDMVVSLASEPDGGLSAESSTQPVERHLLPPGRTRRTRPRRRPKNHTSDPDHAIVTV